MQSIKKLTDTYSHMEGAKVLDLLLRHPGQPIYASVLQNALTLGIGIGEAADAAFHESSIPMTDSQTLREIDAALKRLIKMKAEALAQGSATDSLDLEIAALTKYRKECTRPGGYIKNFPDHDKQAYSRMNMAIKRFLLRAEKDGHHEAVATIRRALRQGKIMVWGV